MIFFSILCFSLSFFSYSFIIIIIGNLQVVRDKQCRDYDQVDHAQSSKWELDLHHAHLGGLCFQGILIIYVTFTYVFYLLFFFLKKKLIINHFYNNIARKRSICEANLLNSHSLEQQWQDSQGSSEKYYYFISHSYLINY